MASGLRFDLPTIDEETRPFWDGCRDGVLRIKRCLSCARVFHYPRPFCPTCWSDDVEWFEASGRGTVYTYSVVHVNDLPPWPERVPYIAAIVELDEGPRLMTNVVECAFEDVHCGLAVSVVFKEHADDLHVPVFRPSATAAPTGGGTGG
jgi:uncharacterized protein